ncbi:hypothetical protein [Oricola thermophila]|uniref:Uncharacterized protein n=1 Tax=Oricola thermophila TaxID=2742145 RepID=A0A6N1V9R1_9HYPH|nr:hypothetical protein [Oricola thermophila]QKV17686.1 hypothetical protein HTY61_03980 [Oricola thermophila]
MMVEPDKLESIARTISQQAELLRSAGRISRADEMERHANELRGFVAAGGAGKMMRQTAFDRAA